MNVNAINPSLDLFKAGTDISGNTHGAEAAGTQSFGSFLKNSLNDVNQLLSVSDKKASELAVGKSENLHDAMVSFEKADTAFKLLVQVRNRAIEAYHEIMRMQV